MEGTISECTNWEEHSRNGDKQLLPHTNLNKYRLLNEVEVGM